MLTDSAELAELIDSAWCYEGFDWKQIEILARHMQEREVKAETVVFAEGDADSYMCLVVQGSIAIEKQTGESERRQLSRIGKGKTFGEMSLIDRQPRSATAIASEPTRLLVLTADAFDRLCEESPGIGLRLVRKLAKMTCERLRQVSGLLIDHLDQ